MTNVIDDEIIVPQSNELVQATRTISRIVLWSFVATIGISLISVLGWAVKLLIVAQIEPNYIPMAPSTALVFILLSVSGYVYYRQPGAFRHQMLAKICGFLAFIFCSSVLVKVLTGTTLDIEQLLVYNPSFTGTMPIGKMSPVTAASFVLASISLLLWVSSSQVSRKRSSDLAAILALIVASIGFVMVVGYSYNAPLLYGGSTIPVALTSAIAFVFLGIGLCTSTGPASWPARILIGSSVHAQLLRIFLPITIIIVIIQGGLDSVLDSFMANRTLGTSTALFLALAIVVIAVSRTARRVGDEIDRAQETLRKSEDRYRTVLEASTDAISVNVGTKIVYANKRCADVLGVSDPGQLVGQDFLEYVTPEDREMVKVRSLGREIGESMPTLYEFMIQRKDGTRIPVETHATAVEYEGRRATLSFRRDITERRLSEDRFRKIFHSSPIPTTLTLPEGPIVDVNDAWLRMMGFTRDEVVGRSGAELRIFPDPEQRDRRVNDLLEKRRLSNIEVTRRAKSGELRYSLNTIELIELSGQACILTMEMDITERKKAEEALRLSEERFRKIFNSSPTPYSIILPYGPIVDVNDAWLRASGYSREEVIGHTSIELGIATDPNEREQIIREVLQKHRLNNVELTRHKKSGETRNLLCDYELVELNGQTCILSMQVDITERKQAEKEIVSLARFPSEDPLPILRVSNEGLILYANPASDQLLQIWKSRVGDFVSIPLSDLVAEASTSQSSVETEVEVGERTYLFTVVLIKDENYVNLYGRDITDRKRLEGELKGHFEHLEELVKERTEKLSESEEKFRGITEASFDPIITLDPKGHITYASPALFLMTGYAPEQVAGKAFTDYLPQDEVTKLTQAFTTVAGGEPIRAQESKILSADGSIVHVEISASPIIGSGGDVLGVEAIIRDITERRRLAEMKDRFVSSVTHELRTPLVSMTGYLDLALSTHGQAPSEVESYLQVVKRNTDRLLSLTNDLLDIQRMEAGRLQLTIQPLNLHEIILQTVREIKPLIDGKKQNLSLKIPEELIPVEADPIRISQVFINLLSNASKFAPEAGEIALSTKEIGDIIQIQVSDNGIGIKREDLERIFQPFASIKKPTYIKGTGLGLSITKGLIEAHEGKIWAESKGEGKGATFTFTIPKRKKTT